MAKETKLLDKLIFKYRKPEYYIPDKYDLEEEFEKYKKKVESDTQESTAFFRLGRVYHSKGELSLAIDNYQRALELEPTDSQIHYNLGNAYFKEGRYDEALMEFSKSAELNPQDVYSYNALANTYLKLGRYHDALNNHRKALRLSAKDPYAFKGMGDVYMHLGNYEEAVNYYQKALESSPDFSMVYYNLGVLYGKIEKYRESIEQLNRAISLDEGKAIFYLALGNSWRDLKNYEKAMENYEKAISLEPKLNDAYRTLIILLCDQGNYTKAIERLEHVTDNYPYEGWPFGILALIYFLKRDYQNAIFYYGMAIDYEPDESSHYSGLGDIYYHQYELTKSGNMYEKAIKLKPSAWDYKQLARIYQEQGLWNLAERNYQEAIRMTPGFYEAYIELSKFYSITGKLEQALNNLATALSLHPSIAGLYALEKGIILMKQGQEKKARDTFLKGIDFLLEKIKVEPENIQNYLYLGLLWKEIKDYEKMSEYIHRAIEIKPTDELYYHLAYAFHQTNRMDKSIEAYKKSLDFNPRFCSAYEGLGIISLNEGKYSEAIDYFNKILEINSRHLYANYHLAKAQEALGNYDKAEEEYLSSLKISDFNHKAHQGLGSLYCKKGDYSKAIKHYERAITLNPGEPIYYSDLGDMYKKRGMNKEAAQAYQKAMRYCSQETTKHPYKNLYSVIMWRHLNVTQAYTTKINEKDTAEHLEKAEDILTLIPVEPLTIELGKNLLPFIDPNYGSELYERLSSVRRHIALELGFAIPRVCFKDNLLLDPDMYILKVYDVEAGKGNVITHKILATHDTELLDLLKGEKCYDPIYNLPAIWIEEDQRKTAEMEGFMLIDPVSLITIHLAEIIKIHIDELFGLQETCELIETIKKINPVVVKEIYPSRISLPEIQKIMRNLLRERVPIRNLVTIFETIGMYSHIKSPDLISEYVRRALKKTICRDLLEQGRELIAFTLDSEVEKFIIRLFKNNENTEKTNRVAEILFDFISKKIKENKDIGLSNLILICSPETRPLVRNLTIKDFPYLYVLSCEEIDSAIKFKDLGDIKLTRRDIQMLQIQLSPDEDDLIEVLANSLKDDSIKVKISALKNMVKINRDKALPHIINAIKSKEPELQIEAQNILGEVWSSKNIGKMGS
ncbi:MAG TPA: tetratricopeptide repeat protein [Candidatus Eremiobacteraeota bacterium]|nr:MAG: Flagellar biosynthesis protein FlhA [bacterium ADurb.Bin363]HPZ07223.1 tetratricopeptide repeat protein [Candidatus Eremiobacteraeota bacterium]